MDIISYSELSVKRACKKAEDMISRVKGFLRSLWSWKWWLLLGLAVVAGGGFWYWKSQQSPEKKYTVTQPKQETIEEMLTVSGITSAQQIARLRFLAGGKVTHIGAQENDLVKKYQTIAVIDRATLKKQLQSQLNTYEKERYDWEQATYDVKDKAKTTTIERTEKKDQLDLESSVLNVEIADVALQNTVLSAPFAGRLLHSPTSVAGVQLTAADYFEVVNPESVRFIARVDEADIGQLKLGQTATITLDAYPDKAIPTQVASIGYQSVETGTGTAFEVKFPLPAHYLDEYRLGMNGDVRILLNKKESTLTIPLIATRERDGNTYVDVVLADGQLEEREITTGIENEESIEVKSGLTVRDKVAVPE